MSFEISANLSKELLSTRLQWTSAIAASLAVAGLAASFAALFSDKEAVQDELSQVEKAQERVEILSSEIKDLRRELVVTRTYTDDGLRDEILEVRSRQDAIEDALSEDIERAFLVASLRKDLDELDEGVRRQESALDSQVSRIYALLAIITGLFVTLFIGGMGWLMATLNRLISLSTRED